MLKNIPLGRVAKESDVATAVAFSCGLIRNDYRDIFIS